MKLEYDGNARSTLRSMAEYATIWVIFGLYNFYVPSSEPPVTGGTVHYIT